MKTIMTAVLILTLTGCANMAAEQQRQREAYQEALAELSPEQRAYYQLEVERLNIERQRANREQIESGLRMMQSSQPVFIQPGRQTTSCVTRNTIMGLVTDCN